MGLIAGHEGIPGGGHDNPLNILLKNPTGQRSLEVGWVGSLRSGSTRDSTHL